MNNIPTAATMNFQLVLQFETDSISDYDRLVHFEEMAGDLLGSTGLIDGHDIGSGEMNIFILTDDPVASFERLKPSIDHLGITGKHKVAFRELSSEAYEILWPPDHKEFTIA